MNLYITREYTNLGQFITWSISYLKTSARYWHSESTRSKPFWETLTSEAEEASVNKLKPSDWLHSQDAPDNKDQKQNKSRKVNRFTAFHSLMFNWLHVFPMEAHSRHLNVHWEGCLRFALMRDRGEGSPAGAGKAAGLASERAGRAGLRPPDTQFSRLQSSRQQSAPRSWDEETWENEGKHPERCIR